MSFDNILNIFFVYKNNNYFFHFNYQINSFILSKKKYINNVLLSKVKNKAYFIFNIIAILVFAIILKDKYLTSKRFYL